MDIPGTVVNGVVVLEAGMLLPDGTRVVVTAATPAKTDKLEAKKSSVLPLVTSGEPGSIPLTNQRIHEILEGDDVATMKRSWNAPT